MKHSRRRLEQNCASLVPTKEPLHLAQQLHARGTFAASTFPAGHRLSQGGAELSPGQARRQGQAGPGQTCGTSLLNALTKKGSHQQNFWKWGKKRVPKSGAAQRPPVLGPFFHHISKSFAGGCPFWCWPSTGLARMSAPVPPALVFVPAQGRARRPPGKADAPLGK